MKKGAKSFTFYALMILIFRSLMYVVIRFYKDEIGGFLRIVEELRLNRKIWLD